MLSMTPEGGDAGRKAVAVALPNRAMLTFGAVVGAVAIPVLVDDATARVEVTIVAVELEKKTSQPSAVSRRPRLLT